MKLKTHAERVAKVRNYIEKNRVFSFAVVLTVCLLFGSFVSNKISEYKDKDTVDTTVSEEVAEESTDGDTSINKEELHWRFYWSDLWILIGGGGFCIVKILQEKRKAREKLK